MSDTLATKYRPTTFSDMVGQKLSAIILEKYVEADSVPVGLLFSGPSGTGKTTAARIIALTLSDDASVIEIDAAAHSGVADMRALIEQLRYSVSGDHRVVIMDEAQSLTKEAFNALLKTLEEPPAGTIFVLVTSEPERVPETVKSRLIEFEFQRVISKEIFNRLKQIHDSEDMGMEPKLLAYIAQDAQGNVRNAINKLDQLSRAGILTSTEYLELKGTDDDAPDLIRELATGDHASVFAVLDASLLRVGNPATIAAEILACLRDLLVLKAGGTIALRGQALQARKDLALSLETDRIQAACRLLWDLKTKTRVSDNPRGNLELVCILMSDVFQRGKTASSASDRVQPNNAPPAAVEPARKLTMQELRERR